MSKHPYKLAPYRKDVIHLRNDEKTLKEIAAYLSQEYSIYATEEEIHGLIIPPPIHRDSEN